MKSDNFQGDSWTKLIRSVCFADISLAIIVSGCLGTTDSPRQFVAYNPIIRSPLIIIQNRRGEYLSRGTLSIVPCTTKQIFHDSFFLTPSIRVIYADAQSEHLYSISGGHHANRLIIESEKSYRTNRRQFRLLKLYSSLPLPLRIIISNF